MGGYKNSITDIDNKVGIGVSSPTEKLDVAGTINAENSYKINGTNVIFVSATYTQLYTPEGAVTIYAGDSADRSNYYDNNQHIFRTAGGASERMRIDSSGRVGIGTTNTGYGKLGVYDATNSLLGVANSTSYAQLQQNGADLYINTNLSGAAGGNTIFRRGAGSTESMRITSGGFLKASNDSTYWNVSGGYHEIRTNQSDNIAFISNSHATTPDGLRIGYENANPNNTTQYFLRCTSTGGVTRLFVYSNGNVVNTNNSYGAISDAKLKENVTDASPKLDDLLQVKVRNFNYIGDDKKQLGVVAQELEEVFPSMIDESPDYEEQQVIDEEGNVTTERIDLGTTTKSVKYSVFVPMLIKAMQEQQEIINDLKARIETLENK